MGVILTVVTHHNAEDSFHVGCDHPGAAFTWRVSDDGYWLIVKSESGVPREQVPMAGIRRLLIKGCEVKPKTRRFFIRPCECGEMTIPYGEGRVTDEAAKPTVSHGVESCFTVPS